MPLGIRLPQKIPPGCRNVWPRGFRRSQPVPIARCRDQARTARIISTNAARSRHLAKRGAATHASGVGCGSRTSTIRNPAWAMPLRYSLSVRGKRGTSNSATSSSLGRSPKRQLSTKLVWSKYRATTKPVGFPLTSLCHCNPGVMKQGCRTLNAMHPPGRRSLKASLMKSPHFNGDIFVTIAIPCNDSSRPNSGLLRRRLRRSRKRRAVALLPG